MAFPHPESRNDKRRNGDVPHNRSVVGKFLKRAVNITDYRNGKDDVNPARNPARNRTFGGIIHLTHLLTSSNVLIIQSFSLENLRHIFFTSGLSTLCLPRRTQ